MRFGIFDHTERRDGPLAGFHEDRLEMIEAADSSGFWCYHKAEHHFTALDMAPSSNVLFAAATQRTERIRLGSLVYLLPFYNPVRLLEEICVVDQLSGGRLEVGVGKGVSPVEHTLWGLDPADAQASFDEAFAILRAGFAGDGLTHAGRSYHFDDVPTLLKPSQPNGPPIWYPGNIHYAGSHRLNTIVGGPASVVAKAVVEYERLVQAASEDWNPGVSRPTIGATRHVYVARTDQEALGRVRGAFERYHANLASLWRAYDTAIPMDPSVGGDVNVALDAQILVAGSPDSVARHIEELSAIAGVDYFVGAFCWGDLTHIEAMKSMRLFAREVMPRFE